jgi:hypothetical protein
MKEHLMSEPASWSEDHKIDAWEVGVHPVPAAYPGSNISLGTVIMHDKETDEWTMVPVEQFDRDYEWA